LKSKLLYIDLTTLFTFLYLLRIVSLRIGTSYKSRRMASIFRDLWGSFFSETYNHSVEDVLQVKTILHNVSSFPLEIIDAVIDLAEYWPHASTVYSSPTRVLSGSGENRFLVSVQISRAYKQFLLASPWLMNYS
jgi:hypothetical protein